MPNFKVVDFNPNETTGGAGCLCDEVTTRDTNPPFVVFYGQSEMDSALSPVPVLCAGCAREAVRQLDVAEGNTLEQRSLVGPGNTARRRPRKETELPEL